MPRAPSMTSAVRSGSGRVIPADDGLGGALRNTRGTHLARVGARCGCEAVIEGDRLVHTDPLVT